MRYGPSCDAKVSASKKTLFALEQGRADAARRRQRWRSLQARLDPHRLVFSDETWIKTNMAPLRGWGAKGARLRGFAPHGHWRTMTFLGAALRSDHRALRLRRPDRRRVLPRLRRTATRSDPRARRHRRHGQSRQPQVGSGPPHDQGCRRKALVLAALLTRSQSDRASLRQDQTL